MNASFFRSWITYLTVAIALLVNASPAKAGLIVAGTEQAHLDMAANPIFQSIGWLAGYYSGGSTVAGTGVLIAPQWVLTAGHVIDNADPFTEMKFSFSSSIYEQAPNYIAADAWYMQYDGGSLFGDDIGLVHLSEPVLDVVPASLYFGGLEVGMQAEWAGYGALAVYPNGENLFDGCFRLKWV